MKHYKQLLKNYAWTMLLVLPLLVFTSACSDDDDPVVTPTVNEAELLVQELEGANGDYLNAAAPALVSNVDVFADVNGDKKFYIIDVRSATAFATGHIAGAHNVPAAEILSHLSTVNAANYTKIVVVCYSGQTASWATALLRMSGYTNAFAMKYGMSSWHSDFDSISSKIRNDRVGDFVTTAAPAKPAAGALPTLSTGLTTGSEILKNRVAAVLAEGFSPAAATDITSVLSTPDQYFVINYWPEADYLNLGHIPGSYQYTPKADFKSSAFLKTLPTDKTIAVYCYTGQTSANVAAILRVMGYDAKSISYGTNGMIWQRMKDNAKTAFDVTVDCKDFPYEK